MEKAARNAGSSWECRMRKGSSMARQRAELFALAIGIAAERADRVRQSAGDDQVDRLRTLALLVGLDVEVDALAFVERFQPGALDCRDVHEHVAAAIVRLDEAVAPLRVEELDRTTLRHREAPLPQCCSTTGPHGAAARPDIHCTGERRRRLAAVISAGPPREAERQSQQLKVDQNPVAVERGAPPQRSLFARQPVEPDMRIPG